MENIWKYSWFKTNSICQKFFLLEDLSQINNINIVDNNIFIWWWSNILFKNEFYDWNFKFVLNHLKWIENLWDWYFKVFSWEILNNFINFLGLSWFSNLLNPLFWIPWTIWGWVYGNCWSFWVEIWKFVYEIWYLNENWQIKSTKNTKFEYRNSTFKLNKYFIVYVIFKIWLIFDSNIKEKNYYMNRRVKNQEYKNTCWSFFKNIYLDRNSFDYSKFEFLDKDFFLKSQLVNDKIIIPAGFLIDRLWLKWFEKDWVRISLKHWNFIVNFDNIYWSKIFEFWTIIKNIVFDKTWLLLEEEIQII